jgi:hypothetical protein
MVAIVRNDLLKRERVAVAHEGDTVKLKFGNVEIKMNYVDALQLAQWIRVRGKQAKVRAGDKRHWLTAVGTLHDASVTRG